LLEEYEVGRGCVGRRCVGDRVTGHEGDPQRGSEPERLGGQHRPLHLQRPNLLWRGAPPRENARPPVCQGFRVQGLGFMVHGLGSRVPQGFRVQCVSGIMRQGFGFRVIRGFGRHRPRAQSTAAPRTRRRALCRSTALQCSRECLRPRLCFGIQFQGFGFRDSGSRFRVSGFRFKVSGFGIQVQGFGFRATCERGGRGEDRRGDGRVGRACRETKYDYFTRPNSLK